MIISDFETKLNQWGQAQVPFLFLADFEMENLHAWKLDKIPDEILFSTPDFTNSVSVQVKKEFAPLTKYPSSFSDYKIKFDFIQERIRMGDSYLANLTMKTKIDISHSLEELFFESKAVYKLCWKNKFLVFSPEAFVQIKNGNIFSFPMKGTIDASSPQAERIILDDQKELSEHVTIVDLIRNDLSAFADNVHVNRFRFLSKVKSQQKDLLQVSSEVMGKLSDNYSSVIGSILVSLLPAGSISGAPKRKTVEILRKAEGEKRGFYTGVFGYFDGDHLDSAVMIRFIEQEQNNFYYRSGGGITAQSEAHKEYQEALDKIYVPIN